MKFKTKSYRPRHKPGRMNNTELEYSKRLELLKQQGEILDYSFECTRIKIGDDCWYTPDFRVLRMYREALHDVEIIEFHEVKGTTRKKRTSTLEDGTKFYDKVAKPFIEDDALVKIKAAAELHPFKFILVWKGLNGDWEKREIN